MKKFIVIAILLGSTAAGGAVATLAPDQEENVQNCATNTTPARAPKRRSVVPQPV